jgi:hypothetical protein
MARSTARLTGTLALAFALCFATAEARAQDATFQTTTTTTAEVTVTGRVTSTTTETVQIAQPAVVAPQPVVLAPQPAAASPLSFRLLPRGELVLTNDRSDPLAGMTALLGADGGDGWGGGLVLGYFGELGLSSHASELHVALEAWRDFSPHDTVGFQLLARAGTAIVVSELAPGASIARPLVQLGIGARMSVSDEIAITLDARGELRLRPAGHAPDGAATPLSVSGGMVVTMGLAIALD